MKNEKQSTRRSSASGAKALRAALAESLHADRELDRNLVLDGEALADLALEGALRPAIGDSETTAPEADAAERCLWLVLVAEHLDTTAAARAASALDHLRELGPLFATALDSSATVARVALVVRHLAEGGRGALAPALDAGLVLLRQHKLRGTGGGHILLEWLAGELPAAASARDSATTDVVVDVAVDVVATELSSPQEASPVAAPSLTFTRTRTPLPVAGLAPDPARFVASLPAPLAPLAAELIRRQARLDPALECEGDEFGLAWVLDDEPLCTLSPGADGLECRLAGTGVPTVLRTAADLEEWLDFLLAHLVERWPAPAASEEREGSFEIPRPEGGGQWLSAEEYEAFRD